MLSLKSVIVTGGSFGVLPAQCPFLERLVVHPSLDLVHTEVCGPSLALQHVEICYCFNLKSITVCNTNLISHKVAGAHCLVLQNCPMLVEVWVSGLSCNLVRDVISWLSCCLSNLEFLILYASDLAGSKVSLNLLSGILARVPVPSTVIFSNRMFHMCLILPTLSLFDHPGKKEGFMIFLNLLI